MKQHNLYSFTSSKEDNPTDAAKLKSFKPFKMKAYSVLQHYMVITVITNYQKFRTKDTNDDPQEMWLKLKGHFQSGKGPQPLLYPSSSKAATLRHL
jgi:hypothetical protein